MNLSDIISGLLNPITLVIIILIIAVGIIKRDKNLVSLLGILGTFIGIVIGLHGIDSNNIVDSIPKLIKGLYTAFFTSVAGIMASIIISFTEKKRRIKRGSRFIIRYIKRNKVKR